MVSACCSSKEGIEDFYRGIIFFIGIAAVIDHLTQLRLIEDPVIYVGLGAIILFVGDLFLSFSQEIRTRLDI